MSPLVTLTGTPLTNSHKSSSLTLLLVFFSTTPPSLGTTCSLGFPGYRMRESSHCSSSQIVSASSGSSSSGSIGRPSRARDFVRVSFSSRITWSFCRSPVMCSGSFRGFGVGHARACSLPWDCHLFIIPSRYFEGFLRWSLFLVANNLRMVSAVAVLNDASVSTHSCVTSSRRKRPWKKNRSKCPWTSVERVPISSGGGSRSAPRQPSFFLRLIIPTKKPAFEDMLLKSCARNSFTSS
mmetsp:Transcript_68348/g.114864  ORF Transcript_68348/g.114864 Transcript_68348/m.114864 type:complete len:238 (+) Transcript_68348:671-1384(+)